MEIEKASAVLAKKITQAEERVIGMEIDERFYQRLVIKTPTGQMKGQLAQHQSELKMGRDYLEFLREVQSEQTQKAAE